MQGTGKVCGVHSHNIGHRQDEDLSIPNFACVCSHGDHPSNRVDLVPANQKSHRCRLVALLLVAELMPKRKQM